MHAIQFALNTLQQLLLLANEVQEDSRLKTNNRDSGLKSKVVADKQEFTVHIRTYRGSVYHNIICIHIRTYVHIRTNCPVT